MAAALVPLQNITLGSAQSSVTFASIPTTGYRDLRLVVSAKPNGTGYPAVYVRANGDSGSNYSTVRMAGNGSTTNSVASSATGFSIASAYGLGPTAGAMSNHLVDIQDAFASDKHKTALARSNTPNDGLEASASRWASTSAITSLTVGTNVDSFAAGSTFALYGVVA